MVMQKLLFIRYKKSKSILDGGEQASQKNYDMLARLLGEGNINVEYIHNENKRKSLADYLLGVLLMLRHYYFGLSPERVRKIVEKAADFDYVWIDRSVFGIIAKKLKQSGYQGQIICFFHNVEVSYFSAKIPRLMPYRPFVLHCVSKNDAYSCQYADKIIALNCRDEQGIEKRYRRRADVLIPVAFKDKLRTGYAPRITTQQPLKCLFVGAYFRPNNEGIKWFVKNVLPYVNVELKIVGMGMDKLRDGLRISELNLQSKISVHPNIPDLVPFFEEADLMILPIFEGAGMKVKTCESLMYGKNILGTSEAFEGYEIDYGQVGGLCNTAEEFIAAIQKFGTNPRPKFNEYSRRIFLEKYSEEAIVEKFQRALSMHKTMPRAV
jgi:glycosyltransferase involved in cell wall biosynthesis